MTMSVVVLDRDLMEVRVQNPGFHDILSRLKADIESRDRRFVGDAWLVANIQHYRKNVMWVDTAIRVFEFQPELFPESA